MVICTCKKCDRSYGYIDSPPAEKCFCGGELFERDNEIVHKDLDSIDYPTVSC